MLIGVVLLRRGKNRLGPKVQRVEGVDTHYSLPPDNTNKLSGIGNKGTAMKW
jgi:hypothetical protein